MKGRHDNGSRVAGGGRKTSMKTTGSGSASCRLASKKPVDRPMSWKGRGRASLLVAARIPTTSLLRCCLCPTERVQRAGETPQTSQLETATETQSTPFPVPAHSHTLAHTYALTRR